MKWFKTKPIINQSTTPTTPRIGHIIKQFGIIVGILAILWLGWRGIQQGIPQVKAQLSSWMKSSIGIVWSTVWDDVATDEMGQISVLIVGIGGEWHRGSYNTDSMMVASYSPQNKAVTFLSIPRDLYVNIDTNWNGRINSVLNAQVNKKNTLTGWLSVLTSKVSSIMGIPIDHYVLVDFQWFEDMIDTLWGIEVNVPKEIVDPTYPADEFRTMVLTIQSGTQMMNGDLALKYARSRHSTSDFDRSLRQQQIIQWIVQKLLSWWWVLKIKQLYADFQNTVTTDLSLSQMIWLSQYLNRIDHYFSFVLQSDCNDYYKLTYPGCLLYSPSRADFGWAAILLPEGATAWRISYYNKIQQFAYYTIYQQPFLVEGARILLWNGIDKEQLLPWQNLNGVTSDVASELVKYGFQVAWIGNNNIKSTNSQLIKIWTGDYDVTADLLRDFAPVIYDQSTALDALSGTFFSGNNEIQIWWSWYDLSEVDLIMVIGNDYLSRTQK